jgi:integrase
VSTFRSNQPVKLTKKVVDQATAPVGVKQAFLRDAALAGFGLRITEGGTKSFIVEKRINGRVRRETLGRFGALTVEQARREAQRFLGKVAMGIDPVAERKTAQAQAVTLAQAFEDFRKARKNLKPKTLNDYSRNLEHHLHGWMRKPITTLTKAMVSRRHREIGESSGKAQANYVFRALKSVLNFAKHHYEDGQGRSVLPDNPVETLNHTRAWYPIARRRTVIKCGQLPAWYAAVQSLKALDSPSTSHVIADFLVFVLFTGLRFSEAAELRWDQVDLHERSLTVPDPKNREPLELPLTDFLVDLLTERRLMVLNEYVFPGRDGKGHLVEPKRQMDHVRQACEIHFTVHDLRRTFATIADSQDIPLTTVKRLVNHKSGNDVTEGYIIRNVERLREAMQRITDFLVEQISIADQSNVITLHKHTPTST